MTATPAPEASKPPSSRRVRTLAAIHAAAERQFLEYGFDGVSMDHLAELAGITKQTVYSHVGSKEALFLEVVDRMTGGAGDALADIVPQPAAETAPEIFLTRFAEEQLYIVTTPRLMKLRRLVIGEMKRFPALGAMLYRRGPARSIARLTEALTGYAADGRLKVDDPQAAASHLNWLIMGEVVNQAMLLGDGSIPDAASKQAHARECVRIFMAAFGPENR